MQQHRRELQIIATVFNANWHTKYLDWVKIFSLKWSLLGDQVNQRQNTCKTKNTLHYCKLLTAYVQSLTYRNSGRDGLFSKNSFDIIAEFPLLLQVIKGLFVCTVHFGMTALALLDL